MSEPERIISGSPPAALYDEDRGLREPVCIRRGQVTSSFYPDGSLEILGRMLVKAPEIGDTAVLRVARPTLLASEPKRGICSANVSGVWPWRQTQRHPEWQRQGQLEIEVGQNLAIRGLNRLFDLSNLNEEQDFIRVNLPGLWDIHTDYVERTRTLKIGERVAINTHRRQVMVDGNQVDVGHISLRILALLATKEGEDVPRTKIAQACGNAPTILDPRIPISSLVIKGFLGWAEATLPDGYRIENQRGAGLRLVVPS